MDKTLYVIDSYGLIFRSYYAFLAHPLTNKDDENVSAVHGFFTNMLSLIQKNGVQHLVAAFDPVTKTEQLSSLKSFTATCQSSIS